MRLHTRTRLALASLTALALGVTAAGAAAAHDGPRWKHKRQLTAMTQNLYLGAGLGPALAATTPSAFVAAVAQIYGTAVFTNFPRRAEAVADTIAAEQPDLIGLQEVTRWIARPTTAGPTPPSFDFLAILQAELAERGLDYSVAGVSENADIGPAPLVAPAFGCGAPASPTAVPDCVVTLQDRDVILVNDDTPRLRVVRSEHGRFAAQQEFTPPGGTPVSFARGWTYVDGRFEGKRFRFLNTHLEVEDFAAVQEAQARELLAGPLRRRGAVIAVGDFNSAADPATTDTPTATYGLLTRPPAFDDAWWVNHGDPGPTCCQAGALANPVSALRTRIDLVLTRGPMRTRSAHDVGDTPIPGAVAPPFWASDHAGVVATLRLH